jgi:hypothetical protein
MRKTSYFLIFFFILAILITPVASLQAVSFTGPIVECGIDVNKNNEIDLSEQCGICDLIGLANNIIQFAIYLAVTVATIMFIVAGMKYLTAGGDPSKISSAHKIFWNVIIGLILVLTAWLIIELIMTTFLDAKFGFWNKPDWCS